MTPVPLDAPLGGLPWIAGVGTHALRPLKWTAEYTRNHPGFKIPARNFIERGRCAAPSDSAHRRLVQLDLNVDARREFQLHQGIDGLVRRIQDVHETLVGADFELVARILVAVR